MAKKAYLAVGISGSGKSTYIRKQFPNAVVCSADHFFTDDQGGYHFDFRKLPEAHAACLKKFVRLTDSGCDLVVDNTNITPVELAPYVAWATAQGYEVTILRFDCSVHTAAKRNTHGVPLGSIRRMADALDNAVYPAFWPKPIIVCTE